MAPADGNPAGLDQHRLAAVFQRSPVAIGFIGADERFVEVNRSLCEFFGYTAEEMIGRTAAALQLWAEPEQRATMLERCRAGLEVRNFEAQFRRKTGELRTALLSLDLADWPEGKGCFGMLIDITDRKTLQAELARAQRFESVGRLASGIAHDMNNILAPIMMAAPMLRLDLEPAEREKMLNSIESSAKRGADLVRQLLIFGGGLDGRRGPTDLGGVIAELVRITGETFPKSIVITTSVSPGLWRVQGGSAPLHQILLNLCVNARDAMPRGGTLAIAANNVQLDAAGAARHREAQPGPYVCLRVTDTGAGVPPELAEKIFDPFFTTKEPGHGTGLGLSTVVGVVKALGGFLTFESQVGCGTAFTVYLPAQPAAVEPAKATEPELPPLGNRELILVVEDEENIRDVLRDALVRHNYQVITAADGAEATAVFAQRAHEIALVVADIDMPYLDGITLAKVLRNLNADVRVLLSTGLSGPQIGVLAGELTPGTIRSVLTKPYTAGRILAAVHAGLNGKAAATISGAQ
jgi:two-component system, cell cycle sensor histidine kinase and response regulator CckA